MVLHNALDDFNQASSFSQRTATPLGMEQYPSVWLVMMKLRDIMGKREKIYQLSGDIELDEAFFPTRMNDAEKEETLKRDAGSQR